MWLDPLLVPDLVDGLCLMEYIYIYMHTINPFYHLVKISKINMLLVSVVEAHKIDLGRLQAPKEIYSIQNPFNTPITSVKYTF